MEDLTFKKMYYVKQAKARSSRLRLLMKGTRDQTLAKCVRVKGPVYSLLRGM